MSLNDDGRLAAVEREVGRLARRLGEPRFRDKRDGRAVLSIRVGDEIAAIVRHTAQQRGCTIADLLRPAILLAVNHPSTEGPAESLPERPSHLRSRTAPRPGVNGAVDMRAVQAARIRSEEGKHAGEPGLFTERPSRRS